MGDPVQTSVVGDREPAVATRPAHFGFCVPIFAYPGPALFRTPSYERLDPQVSLAAAVECERLGYHSVWVADHFFHGHDGAILEGWTTLCVLAGMTSRVRLGFIHLCTAFRNPALLAKMAATLDALSNGRLIFFADSGNQPAEFEAYNFPWYPESRERNARMREALELIVRLWQEDEPVSFTGTYYAAREAPCLPHPIQRPTPQSGWARRPTRSCSRPSANWPMAGTPRRPPCRSYASAWSGSRQPAARQGVRSPILSSRWRHRS